MTPPESGSAPQAALPADDAAALAALGRAAAQIGEQIGRRIVGQREAIDLLLIALVARGHGLFIGVPGLAKTSLIAALAETLGLGFNRVQFTPDLMPSDITGTDILETDQNTNLRVLRFVRGPVFTNILLADEVNRTPPKTQAALLQAMQELQVTAGGVTHTLPRPFHVFATQNPIEQEGTYPLPEAQLDRFMLSIHLTYPSAEEEVRIVRATTAEPPRTVATVVTPAALLAFQELVRRVPVADHVIEAAVNLVRRSRPEDPLAPPFVKEYLHWGAGPRASQFLVLGAKARALIAGRGAPAREDVRALARPVLRHRLVTNFHAEAEHVDTGTIVDRLVEAASPIGGW